MVLEQGNRLLTLRNLLGLSQAQLSQDTGISQAQISLMERGLRTLTPDAVAAICLATKTPATFFEQASLGLLEPLSFRKMASASGLAAVTARFGEIERVANALGKLVEFPMPQLPYADTDASVVDIEELAQATRSAIGLDQESPILNLTRALERKGVAVAPLGHAGEGLLTKHDGISRPSPHPSRPLITYVEGLSGDRLRFTKAHELGHIVLHSRRLQLDERVKEKEAHRFARALLIPITVLRECVDDSLSLNGFLKLKAQWGLSVQAIITHAYYAGRLSETRRKSLMVQLSYKGWRKEEPVTVRPEKPILLRQMLVRSFGKAPYMKASHALGVAPEFLRAWAPGAPDTAPVATTEAAVGSNVVPLFASRT
ncbi:helix-turn-helix domain-containing protein [Sinomonas susongensis]|uniref:helix-turn-helix domain-containing protein n=1 Tax=Sinomonas susongensis TaxID=1324851 RepID=UPI001108FC2D|nr:XRE family transcriptional regulator [Sinomonas susongensis]